MLYNRETAPTWTTPDTVLMGPAICNGAMLFVIF